VLILNYLHPIQDPILSYHRQLSVFIFQKFFHSYISWSFYIKLWFFTLPTAYINWKSSPSLPLSFKDLNATPSMKGSPTVKEIWSDILFWFVCVHVCVHMCVCCHYILSLLHCDILCVWKYLDSSVFHCYIKNIS
jgi:hypothetical protein